MFPTQAIIDRQALRHNFLTLSRALLPAQPVPVIKSDAYGHGAVEVARILTEQHASQCAVFRVQEAEQLRAADIRLPIWILLGALNDEIDRALELDVTLAVWSKDNARLLNEKAACRHLVQPVHLKVDTGMGRLGVLPQDVPDFLQFLATLPHLKLVGAFSHVACADNPLHPNTVAQLQAFRKVLSLLPPTCTQNHLSASAAIVSKLLPDLPFARPGIALYGTAPSPSLRLPLEPAFAFHSRVVSLKRLPAQSSISYDATFTLQRDSNVAVVPVGYASGLPRALSNNFHALVRGRRVPILGRVCMDMTMFDLTDLPDASVDDEVVLIGRQGDQEITAWEIARQAGTIPYDLFCHIGMTQPRTYIN